MGLKAIIKRIIVKFDLYEIYFYTAWKKYNYLYNKYKDKQKIYLLMQPEYGNIGDQMIAYATEKFFQNNFPQYLIICVSEDDTYRHLKAIKNSLNKDDIIVLQGGGNMGNLYPYIERIRRLCMRHLKEFLIVSMPTTVTYTNTNNIDFKKSLKIYNDCRNLVLIARESYSNEFMKKYYTKNCVVLTPDIVFYLYKELKYCISDRTIGMACLRKENEQAIDENMRTRIVQALAEQYSDFFLFDTTVSRTVTKSLREIEVLSLVNMFCRSRFVVTDRMHGMIIAAITETPCVVMKSKDNKVIGSYKWIKDLDYIKLVDEPTPSKILDAVKEVSKIINREHIKTIEQPFNQLLCILREKVNLETNERE